MRTTYLQKWRILTNGQLQLVQQVPFIKNFEMGIFSPCIVQEGRDHAGQKWIYCMATAGTKLKFEVQQNPPGTRDCPIWLWRMPVDNPMDVKRHQWLLYRHHPIWVRQDRHQAQPALIAHKSFIPSVCRIAGRYLMFNMMDMRDGSPFKTDLQVHEAPYPWGPWKTVTRVINFGKEKTYPNIFFWSIRPDTINGNKARLVFTGAGDPKHNNDKYMDVVVEIKQ